MKKSKNLKNQLVGEFRRRIFEENMPRIKKCLAEISETEVWWRPNENSNAIGNLVLHLCGNVRQWILATMAGQADFRERQTEFDCRGGISKQELIDLMEKLEADLEQYLPKITVEDLLKISPVQIYVESGFCKMVHVIEHFSYHTGQIAFAVKVLKNKDLDFYNDAALDEKPV